MQAAAFLAASGAKHVLLSTPALFDQALVRMQLMPGLMELCSFLESQNLPR